MKSHQNDITMTQQYHIFLSLLLLVVAFVRDLPSIESFSIVPVINPVRLFQRQSIEQRLPHTTILHSTKAKSSKRRKPSRVIDPSGPSPDATPPEPDLIDIEDVPEYHYDENVHPIPGQPWRRGLTAGCEDPIDAPWRREAEKLIKYAVLMSNGTYIDTTWYLTQVIITIGDVMHGEHSKFDTIPENVPDIVFTHEMEGRMGSLYGLKPEEGVIWAEDDVNNVMYERDDTKEKEIEAGKYAAPDLEEGESDDDLQLDPEGDVDLFRNEEFRNDVALYDYEMEQIRLDMEEKDYSFAYDLRPKNVSDAVSEDNDENEEEEDKKEDKDDYDYDPDLDLDLDFYEEEEQRLFGKRNLTWVNKYPFYRIASAIMEVLEEKEDELRVLERHGITLQTPFKADFDDTLNVTSFIETQKQFDSNRGRRVMVQTIDPWNSNRRLYGTLVDRNTLDVYINKKGRLVTIPNNFVFYVQLVEPGEIDDDEEEEEEEDDDDMEDEEEEEEEEMEYVEEEDEDYESDDDKEEDEEQTKKNKGDDLEELKSRLKFG